MEQLDPIEALKLIRGLAFAASGSHEVGYLKTTVRDVLVIVHKALPPNSATKQNPPRERRIGLGAFRQEHLRRCRTNVRPAPIPDRSRSSSHLTSGGWRRKRCASKSRSNPCPPAGIVNFWFASPAAKDSFARQRMAVISRT